MTIDNIDTIYGTFMVIVVGLVLAMAGIIIWRELERRKAWREYEQARNAWLNKDEPARTTSNADDFGGFPG